MYVGYEKIVVKADVQTVSDLTLPTGATHAELQCESEGVRYTMDNTTSPNQTTGMLLIKDQQPKLFLIEDIVRIKFCRNSSGTNATLHIHYVGGRDL